MTTQETVTKLLEYISKGENLKAEEELYAADVVSFEQNGFSASGLEAVMAKTKMAMETMEVHSGGVSQTFVGDKTFILIFEMEATPKGGERMQMKEYGFYKLNEEGKVSEEYFFAQPHIA